MAGQSSFTSAVGNGASRVWRFIASYTVHKIRVAFSRMLSQR